MLSKIQKWGNSQGIRIPRDILNRTHISVGEEVSISLDADKIIIEPTHRAHGRYDIKVLVDAMPDEPGLKEEHWGEPVGGEVW